MSKEPSIVEYHVDPSPHYPDDYPAKDNYYYHVIKAGDKVRFCLSNGSAISKHIRTNFLEGVVEEINNILWIRVLRYYTSTNGYEPIENQGPYKLINNFVNRCYTIIIIDANNEKEFKPIKKVTRR